MKTLFSALTTPMNSRSGRSHCLRYGLMLGCVLACSLFTVSTVRAAGVVTEPTEAALNAALQGGGTVTFACDGTIPITNTKKIAVVSPSTTPITVTLDASGHNITLDGGGKTTLFAATGRVVSIPKKPGGGGLGGPSFTTVTYKASWVFKHLTLTNSGESAVTTSYGDVTATDCNFTNNLGGGIVTNSTCGLENCTFTGNVSAQGGGIRSSGGLVTASHCTFLDNHATLGSGGAIYHSSGVTLQDSVFARNTATVSGGAVRADNAAVVRCAFLDNSVTAAAASATSGGALALNLTFYSSSLTNCTLTGNSVRGADGYDASGGAASFLKNASSSISVTLTNCTVAGNTAVAGNGGSASGGGLKNEVSALTFTNTIVAGNAVGASEANVNGAVIDGGHNICSNNDCAFTSTSTSLNNTDPRLGPLVYPGGATPTLSLLGGSPAIDAGDDSKAPATDQRGTSRQGAHRDIGAYERPVWQVDAVTTDTANNTVLLWNHNQGYVCLWNVNSSTGSINTQWLYGPYAGWTSLDVAVGADNHARILWKHISGEVDVWSVDMATGTPLYEREYPAQPGWTGTAISIGGDGNTRLAWRSPQGSVRLWTLDETTGAKISDTPLAPPDGWSFAAMATGADNTTRLLWNHISGIQNIGSVNAAGNVTASYSYGPFAGWTASRLSVGADSQTRLLWNHVNGYQSLWSVNSSSGNINQQILYNIYPGWNCLSLATGRDNTSRLLWNHVSGQQIFWNVDSAFNILSQPGYGPYY